MIPSTKAALPGLILVCLLTIPSMAQDSTERAARLGVQLAEIETKQVELQARLGSLEEDLKPENIEHSLVGIGSTHPEELREARRRQLEIQKKSIQTQLEILATSRNRLEAAIASADAETYRANAAINAAGGPGQTNTVVAESNRVPRQSKHFVKRHRTKRK
jgi:hypothetical protein